MARDPGRRWFSRCAFVVRDSDDPCPWKEDRVNLFCTMWCLGLCPAYASVEPFSTTFGALICFPSMHRPDVLSDCIVPWLASPDPLSGCVFRPRFFLLCVPTTPRPDALFVCCVVLIFVPLIPRPDLFLHRVVSASRDLSAGCCFLRVTSSLEFCRSSAGCAFRLRVS